MKITIELLDPPNHGPAIVACNIAAAIRKACPTARITFAEGGKTVRGVPIPTKAFFRRNEAICITTD